MGHIAYPVDAGLGGKSYVLSTVMIYAGSLHTHFPIALEGCNMEFTKVAFLTPAPLMAKEDCVLAVDITFHTERFHLSLSSCLKLTEFSAHRHAHSHHAAFP